MDITEKTCTSYLTGPALSNVTSYTALLRYGSYGRRGSLSQQERVRLCRHSCQKECSRNLHCNRNQHRQLDPANTGVFIFRSFYPRIAMCRAHFICSHRIHRTHRSPILIDLRSSQPPTNSVPLSYASYYGSMTQSLPRCQTTDTKMQAVLFSPTGCMQKPPGTGVTANDVGDG